MVKDFVKAAGWPFFFFFLFCHEPCAKQLFALLIPIFVSVYCSYLLFYVADVNTACCVKLHGQPVVTHLIAVSI